jgi:hypothetical protein
LSVEPRAWQELREKPWRAWLAFYEVSAPPITEVRIEPRTEADRLALEHERAARPTPTFRDVMDALVYGPEPQQARAAELIDALCEWATHWRSAEPWCVGLLAQQFTYWQDRWPARVQRASAVLAGRAWVSPPLRFRAPELNETRQEYLTAVREAAASLFDDIARRQQESTRLTKRKLKLHARWLAHFEVQGWSCDQIRKRYNRMKVGPADRKTVELAIKALAELIGLKLRAGCPGRKPGVREWGPRTVPEVAHLSKAERARLRK